MKKSLLRVFLVTTLVSTIFISCKKDKDASLEGRWELTSAGIYDFNSGDVFQGLEDMDIPSFPQGTAFEIKSDGTGTANFEGETENFTWQRNGNNLTMQESKFVIKKLNDSELLILADPSEFEEPFEFEGKVLTMGMTFRRL